MYAEDIPFVKLRSPFFLEALSASSNVPGYRPPGLKALAGRLLDTAATTLQKELQNSKLRRLDLTGKKL